MFAALAISLPPRLYEYARVACSKIRALTWFCSSNHPFRGMRGWRVSSSMQTDLCSWVHKVGLSHRRAAENFYRQLAKKFDTKAFAEIS
jgi:hypothetical protein